MSLKLLMMPYLMPAVSNNACKVLKGLVIAMYGRETFDVDTYEHALGPNAPAEDTQIEALDVFFNWSILRLVDLLGLVSVCS